MEFMSGNSSEIVDRSEAGLQRFFSKVYGYMAAGLGVSGLVAWLSAREPLVNLFYKVSATGIQYSVLGWVAIISPLLLVFMISSSLRQMNLTRSYFLFWLFSSLMGVSMSNIFLLYAQSSIFSVFLITAGMFGGFSLYGYMTKKDLSHMGSFLMMGLFGLILASVVNLFLKSGGFNFALSILSVLVFVGLTIYDTNRLKASYSEYDSEEVQQVKAISGALSLYLSFINLFQALLNIMGERR